MMQSPMFDISSFQSPDQSMELNQTSENMNAFQHYLESQIKTISHQKYGPALSTYVVENTQTLQRMSYKQVDIREIPEGFESVLLEKYQGCTKKGQFIQIQTMMLNQLKEQEWIQEFQAVQTMFKDLGGRYKDFRKIGKGAFGVVFKGRQNNEKQMEVAIKQIDLICLDPMILQYMRSEVKHMRRNKCTNLVLIYEDLETDDYLYIVMEYCTMDLEKLWEDYFEQTIPEHLVIKIVRQLLNGFDQLHKNYVIHRDIKLENIFVTLTSDQLAQLNQGNKDIIQYAVFKIGDLGLAKQLGQKYDVTQTYCGSELTMDYHLAPEILGAEYYGVKSDIYSLGCLKYRMLFGLYPYQSYGFEEQGELIKKQDAKFETDKVQVSKEMQEILAWMLKYDPKERASLTDLHNHQLYEGEFHLMDFDDPNDIFAQRLEGIRNIYTTVNKAHTQLQYLQQILSQVNSLKSEIDYLYTVAYKLYVKLILDINSNSNILQLPLEQWSNFSKTDQYQEFVIIVKIQDELLFKKQPNEHPQQQQSILQTIASFITRKQNFSILIEQDKFKCQFEKICYSIVQRLQKELKNEKNPQFQTAIRCTVIHILNASLIMEGQNIYRAEQIEELKLTINDKWIKDQLN